MNEDEKSGCRLPKIKRGKLKPLLFSLLIFVCGMIVGGGIVTGVFGHFIHFGKYPERISDRIVEKMEKKLDLSQDQVTRIKAIFQKRNQNLMKMRKEIAPKIGAEIIAANREIQAVLTPEQKVEWDAWYQKVKNRWTRHLPVLSKSLDGASDGGKDGDQDTPESED